MPTSRTRALESVVIAAFLILPVAGCESTTKIGLPPSKPGPSVEHSPPPHAPAHGYRQKYTYVHYPSCNAYFDRERKLWFWIEGGNWKLGVELPSRIRVDTGEGVVIELESDTPFASGSPGRGKGNKKKG